MQPLADHPVLEAGAVEPYDRFRPHIGRSLLNWKLQKQAFASNRIAVLRRNSTNVSHTALAYPAVP
ncbi:hypothetical protein AGR8A_pAt20029 [Agrobacterium fabrum str. J-07]|nr:hypothetical protein AGR8A_pAt20029 [Agrobacterium fabrum str. J-07]